MAEGTIRVAVAGAAGRMGREVLAAVGRASDMELVAAVDRVSAGQSARAVAGPDAADIPIRERLGEALDESPADVLVDFTLAAAAPSNAISALKRKTAVVIGTSGISAQDLSAIREATMESGLPALLVPNFAIGAVLMVRFAEAAARWLPEAEVIEMHHKGKLDAPSGTAMHTAEVIQTSRGQAPPRNTQAVEKVPGARGAKVKEVPVHSIRLPGFVAHQEVLFSGEGEVLTIRHDSMDRRSFMSGVLLAVREVRSLSGLVVGLDKVMFR
jgi:4-hydroxy-tetrahydrodipicolinate reductase